MSVRPHSSRLSFSPRIAEELRSSGLQVAVTGATGWLGQTSLEMLDSAMGAGFEQRVATFASRARSIELRSGRTVKVAPLADLAALPPSPTMLLHFAYLTMDRTFDLTADEYDRQNADIRNAVAAAILRIGVSHMLFPSSGAVYGLPTSPDRSLRPDPERNPYGTQKIEDERLFLGIARAAGARIAMPRVFSLGGPFINKQDGYALSSIINAVLVGGPIKLRAARRVVRAYTSVRDLMDVSIGWLLSQSGTADLVFDTGGDEAVEVGELASRIVEVMGCPETRIERPALTADPEDRYVGDGRRLSALAEEQGVALSGLRTQILETAEYLAGEK